jgi:hypothetical protein
MMNLVSWHGTILAKDPDRHGLRQIALDGNPVSDTPIVTARLLDQALSADAWVARELSDAPLALEDSSTGCTMSKRARTRRVRSL